MGKPSKVKGSSKVDLRKVLLSQCEEECLCDVILSVGVEQIHAHRCVLAAMSPYFNAMFTGQFREKDEKIVDMSATFRNKKALQDIIQFMYGSELHVTEQNVEEYLKGSSFFQIPELTTLCLEFLFTSLRVANCLWVWMLADTYEFQELFVKCSAIAVSGFPEVCLDYKDIRTVPVGSMLKFLQNGLCSRCPPQDTKTFVDGYVHAHKADKKYKKLLYDAAGLDTKDAAPVSSTTVLKRPSRSKKFHPCIPKSCASSEGSLDEGQIGNKIDGTGHSSGSTEVLCWYHFTGYPSMKCFFILYSVSKDLWYRFPLDESKLSQRAALNQLEGYTIMLNDSENRQEEALVCRSANSFFLINLTTGAYHTLPDVCLAPEGYPEKSEEQWPRNSYSRREIVDSFCLSEQVFVVIQNTIERAHYPRTLHSVEIYVVQLDKVSKTWQFVCCIDDKQLKGAESQTTTLKCKAVQLTEKEVYMVTRKDDQISAYTFTADKQSEKGLSFQYTYRSKVTFSDIDKFEPIKEEKSYYRDSNRYFDVFQMGQEICINVKCGTVSYNPKLNIFGKPNVSCPWKTLVPKAVEKWDLELCADRIYTTCSLGKEIYWRMGSSIENIYFLIQEDASEYLSRKCPIIGKYDFLLRERPEILCVQQRIIDRLTPLSPADYSEPILSYGTAHKALDEYKAKVKPMEELVLVRAEHLINDEGKCVSCACMEEDSYDEFKSESSDDWEKYAFDAQDFEEDYDYDTYIDAYYDRCQYEDPSDDDDIL